MGTGIEPTTLSSLSLPQDHGFSPVSHNLRNNTENFLICNNFSLAPLQAKLLRKAKAKVEPTFHKIISCNKFFFAQKASASFWLKTFLSGAKTVSERYFCCHNFLMVWNFFCSILTINAWLYYFAQLGKIITKVAATKEHLWSNNFMRFGTKF